MTLYRAYFHGIRPGEGHTQPGPTTQYEEFEARSMTAARKVARAIAQERGWRMLDIRVAATDPNPAVRSTP